MVTILPVESATAFSEVRVVHSLLCADASSGVVHQHALQQVQAVLAKNLDAVCVDHLIVLLSLPLREAALEVWEGGHTGPICLGRGSENAEDLEDFVDLGVAWEERLAGSHFGEDAADGPHVDTSGVLAATKQNLRRAVPKGDDLVSVSTERNTEGASETKIGQLQVALLVDEQVLRLQVAVQDAVGMAVASTLEELKGELLDLQWRVSMRTGPILSTFRNIPSPGRDPCVLDVRS